MILTRHAEAFYWAGRYLERAESTARRLDVTTRSAMHVDAERAEQIWAQFVDGMGIRDDVEAAGCALTEPELSPLVLGLGGAQGSVKTSVAMLRENLRTARERVPIELWEEANRLHLRLAGPTVAAQLGREPLDVYAFIRQGCQAVSGVVAEAMTRDEGHAFLVVGRMIERSIGTVQTLGVAFDQGSLPFDVDAMLRSFSALQAFRRRHGLASDPLEVALFLLLAPEVPRSVFACISRLDSRLDSISDADNVTRPRQLVGRLKSRLEFQQVEEEMRADPASTLDSLLTELFAITESVGAHLFQSAEVPTPTAQFIRPGSER